MTPEGVLRLRDRTLSHISKDLRPRCKARCIDGHPCQGQALKNGRCCRHGGLSTGPRTLEGKAKRATLAREQMAKLQAKWAIENGGKPPLSAAARERISRAQMRRWENYRMPYLQWVLGDNLFSGLADSPPELRADERTLAIVERLAKISATHAEAAAILGVAPERFEQFLGKHKNAKEAFESGKAIGKVSLRRTQFRAALNGDTAMLIWLGKRYLGQK